MAIKALIQILGQLDVSEGEVALPVYLRLMDNSADGTVTYGPVAPNQITEIAIAAWAKEYMNTNWNAGIGLFDTVKMVSGIGGLV